MSKSATITDAAEPPASTLIDTSALIALLGTGPAAGEVQEILNRGAAMTTLNFAGGLDFYCVFGIGCSRNGIPWGVVDIGSGLGLASGGRPEALITGLLGEGRVAMMRGCFHVSSLGTDVPGIYGAQCGPVARCVSVADTSLSLSLSLFTG
jgi:hypothetical protein